MSSVKGDPYSKRELATDTEGTVGIIYETGKLARLTSEANSGEIYFFSPETLKWHHSRILQDVYANRYFVTSEAKPEWDIPRTYRVHSFRFYESRRESDGRILINVDISTPLSTHGTRAEAIAEAKRLASNS